MRRLVLERFRRHRQHGVSRQQSDDARDVARLEAGGEACGELALLAGARERRRVPSCRRDGSADRRACALQRSVGGDLACLEHLCDFPRPKGQHVKKNEHRALPRRKLLESDHERNPDRLAHLVAGSGLRGTIDQALEQRVGIRARARPGREHGSAKLLVP
jgi:hypothetical protein